MPPLVTAQPELMLVTIRDVPIMETGIEYQISTGPFTPTTEHLAAAVAAMDDPEIRTPRLKLGHDGKFDGEPTFGLAANLRLENHGHTLMADYVGVPKWLADVMPYAWPARSFEGYTGWKTSQGREHMLAIFAVSLLGVTMPGISTLEDMAMWFGSEPPSGVAYDFELKGGTVPTKRKPVLGAVQVDDLRRQYYDSLSGDQMWWWIRAIYVDPPHLIVDDDEGGLYRVAYQLDGDTAKFGEPEPVVIEYVDAPEKEPAKAAAAVFASREHARPKKATTKEDMLDPKELRQLLGLPEDATDEQVRQKLAENKPVEGDPAQPEPQPAPAPGDQPAPPTAPATTPSGPQPAQPTQPEQVTPAVQVPEGFVLVDQAQWQQVSQTVEQLAASNRAAEQRERDEYLMAASRAGKFPAERVAHYKTLWEKDPQGTRQFIDQLAANVIPIRQLAQGGEDFDQVGGQASEAYPQEWLPPDLRAHVASAKAAGRAPSRVINEEV